MHKAYAVLTEKAFSEDSDFVYVEGIASTPTTDRVGDVVEPLGAKFKTPMPLLMQHMHTEPVGHVTFAKATPKGIPFKAQLPRVKEAGRVKDRVDEAIHSLKYSLISAVSIGFSAKSDGIEAIKGGIRFKEWDWHELSLVTIPANADAVITAIRSFDQPSDGKTVKGDVSPGVSGSQVARKGSVKLIPRNKGK
jgi:HK97 family phage prohead protease